MLYTPTYFFDGNGTDSADQTFSSGDPVFDTHGIDEIGINSSFFTLEFTDSTALQAWRSENRTVRFTLDGTNAWEGEYTLNSSVEYSVSSTYILYTPYGTSNYTEQSAIADYCSKEANAGTITINLA